MIATTWRIIHTQTLETKWSLDRVWSSLAIVALTTDVYNRTSDFRTKLTIYPCVYSGDCGSYNATQRLGWNVRFPYKINFRTRSMFSDSKDVLVKLARFINQLMNYTISVFEQNAISGPKKKHFQTFLHTALISNYLRTSKICQNVNNFSTDLKILHNKIINT